MSRSDHERARQMAEAAGARIYRHGCAWRVVGPTVDVLITDLSLLRPNDFVVPAARARWTIGEGVPAER